MRDVMRSTFCSFRRLAIVLLFGTVLLAFGGQAARAQVCTGDCSGDGIVSLSELITCVNIALSRIELAECPKCDGPASTMTSNGHEAAARYACAPTGPENINPACGASTAWIGPPVQSAACCR